MISGLFFGIGFLAVMYVFGILLAVTISCWKPLSALSDGKMSTEQPSESCRNTGEFLMKNLKVLSPLWLLGGALVFFFLSMISGSSDSVQSGGGKRWRR